MVYKIILVLLVKKRKENKRKKKVTHLTLGLLMETVSKLDVIPFLKSKMIYCFVEVLRLHF